jgi:hypothetical protein
MLEIGKEFYCDREGRWYIGRIGVWTIQEGLFGMRGKGGCVYRPEGLREVLDFRGEGSQG